MDLIVIIAIVVGALIVLALLFRFARPRVDERKREQASELREEAAVERADAERKSSIAERKAEKADSLDPDTT
jgi:Flp pilus assembly protein TadB